MNRPTRLEMLRALVAIWDRGVAQGKLTRIDMQELATLVADARKEIER